MYQGRRKFSDLGGRTSENVLKNKNIRKLPDGTDDFETYFTDSSGESGSTSIASRSSDVYKSSGYLASLPGVSTRSSTALGNGTGQGVTCSSPMEIRKSPRKVIGSRSQKNILPEKVIRKDSYGRDRYEDYYTSPGSTLNSNAENSSTVHPPQSPKSKNSSKKPSNVTHSSPITRLSSSRAICNDTDNLNGSKSEDSEEDYPLISNNSNTFTIKTRKSKGRKRKSDEKRDLCDEELLKLAEENEKAENSSDSQLHATKEANLNISKSSLRKSPSKSTVKKTVSSVSPEKHYFTRSHIESPTKPHSENTDKNSSLNKQHHEQNISKTSHSNAPVSEQGKNVQASKDLLIQKIGSKSPKKTVFPEEQHHLTAPDIETSNEAQSGNMDDISSTHENTPKKNQNTSYSCELRSNKSVNTAQDSGESSEENGVADKESTLYGNEDAAKKSTTKRKLQRNKSVNTAQDSGESSEENGVADKESTSYGNEDAAKKSPTKRKLQRNKSVNTAQDSGESSEENDVADKESTLYGNEDAAKKSTTKRKLQRNKSVNTAQDSGESSEENGVADKESTSYENEDAVKKSTTKRKSSLTSGAGSKKKAKSILTSATKYRPEDKGKKEHKEKMSLSLNISERNLNRSNKNAQHVEVSLHSVLGNTFQVNNPVCSLSNNGETLRETNKNEASSQVSAEVHINGENGKQNKANKSRKNPKPKTKDKRSSVSQENEAASVPRRTSGRKRIPPLENWRNQRAIYRIEEDGKISLIELDPGTKEDDGSKKAIAARLDKYRKMKELSKKRKPVPPKFKINDVLLKKNVTLPLIKKFHQIPWEDDETSPYCIKRVVQTPNSNFGFIEVKAGKSKPLQYLPNEDIYLCLIKGKLNVLISDRQVTLEEKDTLVVPRSVPYTLRNDEHKKAVLIYSVGRFKYLENILLK